MKNLAILGCVAVFFLVGCATPYQEAGFAGGFDERQLSRNEFAVGFSGNGYTSGQRAIDLCMLRCAEITLGHGFHYFVITGNNFGYDNSTSLTTANYFSTGYGNGFMIASSQTVPKPSAVNRILCFRDTPQQFSDSYDAQNEYDQLSQKYGIDKQVQQFPQPALPIATIGIEEGNLKVYHPNLSQPGPHGPAMISERQEFDVQFLQIGNPAREAGVQVGDEILALDGIAITNVSQFGAAESDWQLSQTVQVKVRRSGKTLTVPVKTCFNPVMRFKKKEDFRIAEPLSESDVTVIDGSNPRLTIFNTEVFGDWECPVDSDAELRRYLVEAAISEGANGVVILRGQERIKEAMPSADARLGFVCYLGVIPKAHLGLEYESGQGYENRRVIRRLMTAEANDSGLQIGDNVLAINGIDPVLQAEDYEKDQMSWEVGQKIPVTVARNGKEVNLTIRATANRL